MGASDVGGELVEQVRSFNRFYTRLIGVLTDGLVGTPYSLTEARVLFELAQRGCIDTAELRRLLDLDAGYLSRLLARFVTDGLVRRDQSTTDARRHVLTLTDAGRAAFATLDARQVEAVEQLLEPLSVQQRAELASGMSSIRHALGDPPKPQGYVLRQPEPGDLGWVVARHGALYAAEYGWDSSFEALVARVVADYVDGHDPKRDAAWIAEIDGAPVGSVFCAGADASTAKLRLLLVDPAARGMGIGARLVEECLRFARRVGYSRITLWTNDVLTQARRIYEQAGFHLDTQARHHSFGHDLIGQYWSREL
ncbi:MAG: GNAT family N-acetyltransferase [Propionibacteriales bacterium]|nr:GNAT family N-acetyltransferase [Propionibacteriales bacterium]